MTVIDAEINQKKLSYNFENSYCHIDSEDSKMHSIHINQDTYDYSQSGISQLEQELCESINGHLYQLGFTKDGNKFVLDGQLTKQRIRDLHSKKREELLKSNRAFIDKYGLKLMKYFADGKNINPEAICPELIEVKSNSEESRLFRFACLLWSVPVSQGFGRRMRFLVKDKQNGCLIGVFALGDPVFNLSARDKWIGWSFEDRKEQLKHIMDAYVLGSVPPYSKLIGGKLVAALIGSKEVQEAYNRKYIGRQTVIGEKENKSRLVLLTTTSSMGRSSLYNRLKIPNGPSFIRIGETKGYGHFQISSEIFEQMRLYLNDIGHPYATGNEFGMGPNWKMRVVRATLEKLHLNADSILNHGIAREVYVIPLASNWKESIADDQINIQSNILPASEIINYCLSRWILPRACRDNSYQSYKKSSILEYLRCVEDLP